MDTVKHFEQVRAKLSSEEVAGFEPLGQSLQCKVIWSYQQTNWRKKPYRET